MSNMDHRPTYSVSDADRRWDVRCSCGWRSTRGYTYRTQVGNLHDLHRAMAEATEGK